jgi:hypothetical protein
MKTKHFSLAVFLCIVSSHHLAFGAKSTEPTQQAAKEPAKKTSKLWGWLTGKIQTPKTISPEAREALNKQLWDLTKKGDATTVKAIWDYVQKRMPQIPIGESKIVSIITQLPYSAYASVNSIDSAEQVIVDLKQTIKNLSATKANEPKIDFFKQDCTYIETLVKENEKKHASYVKTLSKAITALIEKGADATAMFNDDITGKKTSSLGNALRNNELEILEVLLGKDNKGINNQDAIDGKSLLAYACDPETKNPEAIKILVEHHQQNAARDVHNGKQPDETLKYFANSMAAWQAAQQIALLKESAH